MTKKNQAVILGIPFDFEYTPPKGKQWPPSKNDKDCDPFAYYECYECGWTYRVQIYGSFAIDDIPKNTELALANILEFHQTRCSKKSKPQVPMPIGPIPSGIRILKCDD